MSETEGAHLGHRPPSMMQVAKLAGVSAQTVSRVLSGHKHVAQATRDQVLEAVEAIGYRKNSTARALVTGRSKLIGVVTFETNFYAANSLVLSIQAAAREHGYFVTNSSTGSVDLGAIKAASDRLTDQGVDGQVLAVPVKDVSELERALGAIPAVVIGGTGTQPSLSTDQTKIGHEVTRHLLDLGHKTVWHVAGPEGWGDAAARAQGWRQELIDAGREVPPILYGDWTPGSGYRNGLLLGHIEDATAVFVSSDEMALGLMAGLREMGRRVPEDVSVVGVDDIALAEYSSPPLTTWHQPFWEVGAEAVEVLLQQIDEPTSIVSVSTPLGELVVRGSTQAPQ